MSTIKANKHQIGSDPTPANNIVLTASNGDLIVNQGVHDGILTEIARFTGEGLQGDVSGTTVATSGDIRFSGSSRGGDNGVFYVAKKVKRNIATNSATTTHTLSCTSPGGAIHRSGYLLIWCSGIQTDISGLSAAWFMYKCRSLSSAYPAVFTLVDSGGDTAAFTVSFSSGVVTVSTVMNDLTTNVEFGFSTGNVNVT